MKGRMVWQYSANVPFVDEKGKSRVETRTFNAESDIPEDATDIKRVRVKQYS